MAASVPPLHLRATAKWSKSMTRRGRTDLEVVARVRARRGGGGDAADADEEEVVVEAWPVASSSESLGEMRCSARGPHVSVGSLASFARGGRPAGQGHWLLGAGQLGNLMSAIKEKLTVYMNAHLADSFFICKPYLRGNYNAKVMPSFIRTGSGDYLFVEMGHGGSSRVIDKVVYNNFLDGN
uniref:Uncharacterized protein n=1 Tax=Oryza punctata TaxID=4537 RepID=A0A0E0LLA4_ORYPU